MSFASARTSKSMASHVLSVLLLCSALMPSVSLSTARHWQYIIIGAGPSGLQLGYFFHRAQRDYVILERSNASGSFFTIYPRHDKLISINKRHTGKSNKEFNLRHDWNSLISDDESLKFGRYSKEFFPRRLTYVKYLNDFSAKFNLNILYGTDVHNISRSDKSGFSMNDQNGNEFTCNVLIIGTGMWQPNLISAKGVEFLEGYESVSTDPEDFEGQSVLILGRGNAAFEVADRIYGHTNLIHMVGRSRVRLSWSTHYVGDLRGINNALLDTYQLKSLDAVLEAYIDSVEFVRNGSKLSVITNTEVRDNFAIRDPYDRIIRCLGFKFNDSLFSSNISLTRGSGRLSKYPKIDHGYESVDAQGLHFIGTATHSLDLRKSAGGFIHGFRYTVRALHRLLEWKYHNVRWTSTAGFIADLIPAILKRINEASGIYQMFGMLCDVIVLKDDKYEYFEEFPVNLLHEFVQRTGSSVGPIIVIMLEYGANFSGPAEDTFRYSRATGYVSEAHNSNFLHPVFYYYKQLPTVEDMMKKLKWQILPRPDMTHHILEDFLTRWDAPQVHIMPLRRFLENVLDKDLRHFTAEECLLHGLTHQKLPPLCEHNLNKNLIIDNISPLVNM